MLYIQISKKTHKPTRVDISQLVLRRLTYQSVRSTNDIDP